MSKNNVDEYPLGARIKYFRERRGLTQAQLAKDCQLAQPTVSLIESSQLNPSMKVLKRISQTLDVHMARLFESDHVAVLDLRAMSAKYDRFEKLPEHLVRRLDDIVQYLRFIDWHF
ncbi:MAG: XRE family transcriptional regulator [Proteobacteria bacterium]|nr:MAG: XRE family transcriptional regulator [Pseudomonadota bacterium]